jgi:hypothetical protein
MSNKPETTFGILGSGDVNPKIVKDGLADTLVYDDVRFLIHARRNPQGAVETVYDFIDEHQVPFMAFHRIDDRPPKALMSLTDRVNVIDDPAKAIISVLASCGGTLLLLWDEENTEASEKLAIMAADAGVPIKDLSNGLAPIHVESDEPVVKETPRNEESAPEMKAFTYDELMGMGINLLRRQAKAMGIDKPGTTKEDIAKAILGFTPVAEPTLALQPLVGCLVYTENGVMQTVPLDSDVVAQLLGRC